MNGPGWFADIDEEQTGKYLWQPCVQTNAGCYSIEMWFDSEAACEDFIRKHIAGLGMYENLAGKTTGLVD